MSRKVKTGYPSIDKTHLAGIPKSKLNPKILPLSMFGTFMLINSRRLSEPAIQVGEKVYSKREVKNDVISVIRAMKDYSFAYGDTLAIATPNCYEGIVMTIAANAIGVRVAYLNPLASDDELIADIDRCDADHVLVYDKDDEFSKKLYNNEDMAVFLLNVINVDTHTCAKGPYYFVSRDSTFNFISYASFKTTGDYSKRAVSGPISAALFNDNVSLYLQTSGSTSGKPKILPFTNEAIFGFMMYAKNSTGTQTNDEHVNKVMPILPFRLPYGWMGIFINFMAGHCVCLAPGATAEDIGTYYKYKPSYIYGTPTILRAFIDNTPEDADLSWLEAFFCAGFSVSESWYQECMDFLKTHGAVRAEIRNNYGIGEGLCIGTSSDGGVPHYKNTVGRFYLGPEFYIVDENMNEVKYGEIGEAIVYSKTLCKGYLDEPELTKECFIEYKGKTFYRTGDYMSVDEDGIVTFFGRKKRFFQPLGATDKVNCETVEKAILECPIVKNCAVVVKRSENMADYGKAFVVLNDKDADRQEAMRAIHEFIKKTLLDYQIPEAFSILDEIPMMKSGKIDYNYLENI